METMRELLIQWSKFEPDKCEWNGKNIFTIQTESGAKNIYDPDDLGHLDLAWIQWGIQEAITGHTWSYKIGYDAQYGFGHEAEIETGIHTVYRSNAANSVEALLTAYLVELKNQTESTP
jgi:hypothetical protein